MTDAPHPGDRSEAASAARDAAIGLVAQAEAAVSVSVETFCHMAAVAGMYEIEAAKIAVRRAKDTDVKTFAQNMISDHTKIDSELKSWMGGMVRPHEPPSKLDKPFEVLIDDLNGASDADFDHRYVSQQEAAHRAAVTLFKNYGKYGQDLGLKNLVNLALPVLEQHLETARVLAKAH
jgi:putative membrane protein